jgi:hypothetical protein
MAAANIAALGFITAGAAVALAATAAADPPPPPDPAPAPADPAGPPPPDAPLTGAVMPVIGAPLGPQGLDVLAQRGQDGNPAALGAPALTGMDLSSVLGQNAVPSPPGANPGAIPNLNPFNNGYGVQQCLKPSAPGKCQEFGVDPGDENADVSRRQWLGRYFDMQRAGLLKGGMIGQMPQEQLGEPLPGTAPPPGTRIPPGLDQFQPDPAAPPDGAPPPPPAPGAPLPPPPPG